MSRQQARQLRDREDRVMTGKGHSMKWRRGHEQRWLKGVPGFTGQCAKCGDVVRVGATGGSTAWISFEDAQGGQYGPRLCRRRRPR